MSRLPCLFEGRPTQTPCDTMREVTHTPAGPPAHLGRQAPAARPARSGTAGAGRDWAELIQQIRKLNHWSQEALAERLRTDQATVSRWERGVTRPAFQAQQGLEALAAGAGLQSLAGIGTVVRESPFPMILVDREGLLIAASLSSGFVPGSLVSEQTPADERAFLVDFGRRLEESGFWDASDPQGVDYAFGRRLEVAGAVVVAIAVRGQVFALVQKRPISHGHTPDVALDHPAEAGCIKKS